MVVHNRVFEVEEVKRRCILVGLQLNGDETDLLSWDVVNVVKQGDRLIAVHVSKYHQGFFHLTSYKIFTVTACILSFPVISLMTDTAISQTPTLLKILDDFMADHEDICIKKQVLIDALFTSLQHRASSIGKKKKSHCSL